MISADDRMKLVDWCYSVVDHCQLSCFVVALSYDHKPDDEEEERRINDAGGYVSAGRVEGDLAVSHGLGDFRLKEEAAVLSGANGENHQDDGGGCSGGSNSSNSNDDLRGTVIVCSSWVIKRSLPSPISSFRIVIGRRMNSSSLHM
jgi:serine/threonine protein phosphatase PrpC